MEDLGGFSTGSQDFEELEGSPDLPCGAAELPTVSERRPLAKCPRQAGRHPDATVSAHLGRLCPKDPKCQAVAPEGACGSTSPR